MKGVLFIIDGLGDLPIPAFEGRTPLEAAQTPFLDRLAGRGRFGVIDPIAPGVLPNTHSGAGMLLGMYPGQVSRLNRGPVEAAGLGLQLQEGDVALRANFATLERAGDDWRVVDRRAGRIRHGTAELAEAMAGIGPIDGVSVLFQPTEQHRGVLVLSGPGLDAHVSDTDPGDHGDSNLLKHCRALSPGAERTASLINRYGQRVRETLQDHPVNQQRRQAGLLPANGLLTRGAGHPLALDNLVADHGIRASVVSGCNTVKGLGRLLGFRVIDDARFTADLDTDLDAKVRVTLDELQHAGLVFVHVKAPDICAHDRDPVAKRDLLSRIDQSLGSLVGEPVGIAVAADHTTDSNTGRHTADPVPAFMCAAGSEVGEACVSIKFGETACRNGNLPRVDSHGFLQSFLEMLSGGILPASKR